jgi:hypothetical protein
MIRSIPSSYLDTACGNWIDPSLEGSPGEVMLPSRYCPPLKGILLSFTCWFVVSASLLHFSPAGARSCVSNHDGGPWCPLEVDIRYLLDSDFEQEAAAIGYLGNTVVESTLLFLRCNLAS